MVAFIEGCPHIRGVLFKGFHCIAKISFTSKKTATLLFNNNNNNKILTTTTTTKSRWSPKNVHGGSTVIFLTEIEMRKSEKEAEKEAEQRRKTVIVGDMHPLATSLPTISTRYVCL